MFFITATKILCARKQSSSLVCHSGTALPLMAIFQNNLDE